MALAEYRRKRHFRRTPEPTGKATKRRASKALSFVIQKHDATRLHYDLRLELDGVLKSWAVPKGPSLDPSEKRLAVEVEDHPLEYAKFEGLIPEGEYGAGEVIVWDRGAWIPDGDPAAGLRRGKLEFELHGNKLSGGWRLLRLKDREGDSKHNWLLMKRTDDAIRRQSEFDITAERPESIKSGRLLSRDQSAAAESNGRTPRTTRSRTRKSSRSKTKRKSKAGSLPTEIHVQLATLVAQPPHGPDWVHEVKFDGYRLIARIEDGKASLITRNLLDWTHRYPPIAKAVANLPASNAILDGEVIAQLPGGVGSFQALQNALKSGSTSQLVYYAFDLLFLDGRDLRGEPLVERKKLLAALVEEAGDPQLQYSEHFPGDPGPLLAECCRRGLEGIITKRGDRPYIGGRTTDWLKIKCLLREEFVIGGFTISPAVERGFGALLVGYFRGEQFVYAGRVGTGFDTATLTDLRRRLDKLVQPESPFATVPPRERVKEVRWVRPELVAEVAFGSWTDSGVLRHPAFQGLREDKPARSIGRPETLASGVGTAIEDKRSMPTKRATGKGTATRKAAKKRAARPKGADFKLAPADASHLSVRLTNPDRVLFADVGLTKAGLAQYYADIADWILPHLAGRPLSMLRCPEGQGKPCFFQKHAAAGTPEALRRIDIKEKHESEVYLIADDLEGLLSLAQMSILEIHPWGSRGDRLEQPDRLIFDLDPHEDVSWQRMIDAAVQVRETLEQLGLQSFLKTTGGKGLHVVVPLNPRRHEWEAAKAFTRTVAQHFADEWPDLYTATMAKAARKGRIFIDYLRNDRGATAVAPYSTRARPGAPVSTPLAWDELSDRIRSDQFRVDNVRQRLKTLKRDPWQGFFDVKQQLPKFVEGKL
jgi:bifunctional non-homologous end joining protein LigD